MKNNLSYGQLMEWLKKPIKKLKENKNRVYWQYRVAANITEYHSISKLIFLRLIIQKFMKKRRFFHVIMYVRMSKINMF